MNEEYFKKCCRHYSENKLRLMEVNEKLTHYGSLTQNFSTEKGGYDPLSKSEKAFIAREKLREEQEILVKQIRIVDKAGKIEPVIRMRTKEGISGRRFAEIHNTTHWDARMQYERAMKRYVQRVNGKTSKC